MLKLGKLKSVAIATWFVWSVLLITSCKDHVAPEENPVIVDNPDGNYPLIQKEVSYKVTEIPSRPQDLVYNYDLGKPVELTALKDTVVVFVEGGPKHVADTAALHNIDDLFFYLAGVSYSVIAQKQAHFINPTVFGSGSQFTAQNAKEVNNATFEMIEHTIKWLKSANKVVILFGHSNGALVTQAYLTTGKTLADFTFISATRLIAVPEIISTYNSKKDFHYEDGTTLVLNDVPAAELPYFNVVSKLQIDNLREYATLFVGKPFLPRTVYMFGAHDEALGVLTDSEKKFLTDNKVPNLAISQQGGGHGTAIFGVVSAIPYIRTLK